MGSVGSPGLVGHLRDAIRLNRARRAGYVRRGGPRAAVLSRLLVGMERALLPAAWILDRQAAPFHRAGVPILSGDLADLADAPGPDRPLSTPDGPGLGGRPPLGPADWVGAWRAAGTDGCVPALRLLLGVLREAERRTGRHHALTVHVVESAGWMALRGESHAAATDGATRPLTRRLVRGHLLLLPVAVALDRAAAPLHARGVGLFVNDLPPVPFEAAPHAHA